MTFCWSFVDVMIMVISIGLATRFNQINDRMQTARGKVIGVLYGRIDKFFNAVFTVDHARILLDRNALSLSHYDGASAIH